MANFTNFLPWVVKQNTVVVKSIVVIKQIKILPLTLLVESPLGTHKWQSCDSRDPCNRRKYMPFAKHPNWAMIKEGLCVVAVGLLLDI